MKDYYVILGLERRASSREIKRAYKKLVRKWHPDLHPEDIASGPKIRDINEAYEILSDPEKRQAYDHGIEQTRMAGDGHAGFYPAHEGHPFFSYFLRVNEALRKRNRK